ncbi:hypothetical protein LUZ60_007909 [Juncus effusus]|nr:hypothetical protein LUZ60_007909 [Juncus effusus]
MEKKESVLVLYNAMVVTMDSECRVIKEGAIAVSGDRIAAVGPTSEVLSNFSHSEHESIDLNGRILLPGFVNTHVHTSQQLGRGIADDVDLMTWLHERIWPYESHMTYEDSYLSTLLCGIEMVRSGVTCFAEAGGQHVPAMAGAVEVLGLRGCLTQSVMDSGDGLPPNWRFSTDQCIQSQKELYEKYNDTAEGRIRIWFGLRQIMNATDELLLKTRDIAQELKTGIHMHIAEIPYENELVKKQKGVDHGTVTYLEKIGLIKSNLLAAHSVWLNQAEIGYFAKGGVKVSHCPASAMRLLGFAPIKEYLEAGVCVSLGTDGAPSNNRMSIVDEMYLTSLINKGRETFITGTTNPTAVPAETVLKMATIDGARSVLWDDQIGSLEPGKKADMIVVNPFTWTMVPLHDCISNLVYCMRSENIESVLCNGKWIMKDRKIVNINEEEIIQKAMIEGSKLISRAGIKLPNRMKFV